MPAVCPRQRAQMDVGKMGEGEHGGRDWDLRISGGRRLARVGASSKSSMTDLHPARQSPRFCASYSCLSPVGPFAQRR